MHSRLSNPPVGRKQQGGFTLIEILVAMLVLAIGLLGIAAMQMRGLQYNHDAYQRSQISVLAMDIADRIRLNRQNAGSYVGDYAIPVTRPTGCAMATASASNDLECWRTQVYDALPPGSSANITQSAGVYNVALSWVDRTSDGNSSRTVNYTFMP